MTDEARKTTALPRILRRLIAGPNGCCLWTGATNPKGYGSIKVRQKVLVTHRVVFEHFNGPIPAGLEVDHLCRVRRCCNPHHLQAVTHEENVRRSLGLAALNAQKTHCDYGHEFTPENTAVYKGRKGAQIRRCRTCARGWNADYRARQAKIARSATR